MIMSLERRFIFIHIYKNAGTSIKRALRPYTIPVWQAAANQVLKRIGLRQFCSSYDRRHVTAAEVINEFGHRAFDSCFSFAIVRNPWDWEVSQYKYICKNKLHPHHSLVSGMGDFGEYLVWKSQGPFRLQQEFIDFDHRQAVSFVGRFENLDEDFRIISKRIGLDLKLATRNTTSGRPYQEYYDRNSVELIKQMYQLDLERFQYEFESSPTRVEIAA